MVRFCSAGEFDRLCQALEGKAERVSLQAKGGSMYPFIHSGDTVELELSGCRKNAIAAGDIILFRKEDSLYLHRVLRRSGNEVLVKGDLSFGCDGFVPAESVLARARFVLRRGIRRIDLYSPGNRMLAVCAAAASVPLQYPLLAARIVCAAAFRVLLFLQGWRAYRCLAAFLFPCTVIVREAGGLDEEQLRDLYLMAGHDLREGIARMAGKGFWLIAQEKKRIVGGLTVSRGEDDHTVWMIFGLEVKPLCRGRGVGRLLVRAALEKAQAAGARSVCLFVNKSVRAAVELYRSIGFTQQHVVPVGYVCSPNELCFSYALAVKPDVHARMLSLLGNNAKRWVGEGVFYPLYLYAVPSDSAARMIYYEHVSKSAAFSAQVDSVLERIESLGIPVILFKGPAIDHLIYDDFLRPRLDLDIAAMGDEHHRQLEQALISWGYSAPADEKTYPLPEYANSRLFMPGLSMNMPAIHIHRHIINNMFLSVDGTLALPMERVWEETEPFQGSLSIRMLRPEMNIVFLCEHGLKHDFDQLVYLYEIERLLNRYGSGFDWHRLVFLARESGFARAVYFGLYCAQEMCSAAVDKAALAALTPGSFSSAEKKFIKTAMTIRRRRYGAYAVYCAMRRGWFSKARFIVRTLVPPGFSARSFIIRLCRWGRGRYAG